MNAKDFYDGKEFTKRNLYQGSSVRNAHNFIKAVLIKSFIGRKKRILDLGCGQGGDLLKIKICEPSLYVGIDISPQAVVAAQERASKIKLKCRNHFLCSDFTSHDWEGYPPYDVINSQFAIQFAFQTPKQANFTIEKISRFLVEDGLFIGTVPQHPNRKTYDEINVKLPDDERTCQEYCVDMNDFIYLCEKNNLVLILNENFTTYFNKVKSVESTLAEKMSVHSDPDPNNIVFAFQKRKINQHTVEVDKPMD